MKKIAVIIPAFNEGKRIGTLLERIPKQIEGCQVIPIVVDDGSRDQTAKVAAAHAGVMVIRHQVNLGKGGACKTGCDAAYRLGVEVIVLMDADLQHRPEDIERLIKPVLQSNEAALAIGTRQINKKMPLAMRLGNHFLNQLANLFFHIKARDTQSGFRAFPGALYPLIRWRASNYAMETEMLILAARQRMKFVEVPIETIYLDKYKGTTVLDGLRILRTLCAWRLFWFQGQDVLAETVSI